jgi:hypothetical protein
MCLVLGIGWASASSGAKAEPAVRRAAPAASVSTSYDEAISRAFSAFESKDYLTARSAFLEAHALQPSARTLRALGKVAFELSSYDVALAYLEEALASPERPLTSEQRAETEKLCAQLQRYVAKVSVSTEPADAIIRVDHQPYQPRADGAVILLEGAHVADITATGYQAQRHTLQVLAGRDQQLTVALVPTAPTPPAPSAPLALEHNGARKWWIVSGIGGAVALAVITGLVVASSAANGPSPAGGTTGTVLRIPASVH